MAKGILADAEYWHIAYHLDLHDTMDVIADVGDAVEMYEVAIAIIDERDNLFAAGTGEIAEQEIWTGIVLQPIFDLRECAKTLDIGWEMT